MAGTGSIHVGLGTLARHFRSNPGGVGRREATMMRSLARSYRRPALVVAMTAATITAGHAQRIQVPLIDVDCSAYQRQDDGKWIVLYKNRVVLGGNVDRTVVPSDDPQTFQLVPGTSLDRVLGARCGRLKKK
jgi:hypothetical protein